MGMDMIAGLAIGVLLLGAGYFVRTKQVFAFLAGFGESWQPVNEERLGNRIGILLMILGAVAIFTSVFTIWFGETAGKVSGIVAIIDVIAIIAVIVIDQTGH